MKGEILLVEYLYDAVRALAEQDIVIQAIITDEKESEITENCKLVLYDKDKEKTILAVEGKYLPEDNLWQFTIPAEATKNMRGRYWYCIQYEGNAMCFKQPIYLM